MLQPTSDEQNIKACLLKGKTTAVHTAIGAQIIGYCNYGFFQRKG